VHADARGLEAIEHRWQQPRGCVAVHEQGLEGVADARALHLGVEHDIAGDLFSRGFVEEHVHDPRTRLDHGNL
jgi:hypothetical protein